ncbi:hypothetical protein JOQ06_000303 [Pogonophryne albipinna]|uniref:Uncharacterized protein n=1 Tax=Pogonophryne albipinna TaxID=1090488 RepID=A0AAD6AG39_9TELE|nr:hypothetical protein JOQ06_000303 [Pogonophryne albipinna]
MTWSLNPVATQRTVIRMQRPATEEATVDVKFTDLPNALIACKVPEDLFKEDTLKVSQCFVLGYESLLMEKGSKGIL